MTKPQHLLHIAVSSSPRLLPTALRSKLASVALDNFQLRLTDEPSEEANWNNAPPAARADQLKAWLAEHWMALEEPLVLLLPGDNVEPGVLNIAAPDGSDLFIGVASLSSFIEAARKLNNGAELPGALLNGLNAKLPVWLAQNDD